MLRARIIAHPNQNTSSLHESLKQSGYKVEQIAPGESAHHDAHLEINLTDGSFEWTEPDLPVAAEPVLESAPVVEASEPAMPREFILAPLFRNVSAGWSSLRERARGGAAIAGEGASVLREVGGNALAGFRAKLNAATASASARADEWKREMERKREQTRRERAEKSLFAVPPKPPVAKVETPKVEAPKYEPVVETVKPEPVLERLQVTSPVVHDVAHDEDTRVLAAHEPDVPLFAEPPKKAKADAASAGSHVTSRDRNWRQSMAVAAALVLAFLIGWSVGTRDDRPEFKASDATQAVADSPVSQPAVVTTKPVDAKPAAQQIQVAKAAKRLAPKHRVERNADSDDDVEIAAEDVVVHHYPSIQQKYAKNNKQASVKRISDIE